MTTAMKVSEYTGFDLAIGSVFGLRWFQPDSYGRLRGPVYFNAVWKPGENVAKCRLDDNPQNALLYGGQVGQYFSTTYTTDHATGLVTATAVPAPPPRPSHDCPSERCRCGFYAFAEGCDDGGYKTGSSTRKRVMGVVECYGRTIIGTKGLRAEKAIIRGLLTDVADIRRLYPDVRYFGKEKRLLRAFDLVSAYKPNPADDPAFWNDAA